MSANCGEAALVQATQLVGVGPTWHVHSDVGIVPRPGRALFTIGDESDEAGAGDVLLGPAEVPAKSANLGPGPLESCDIHLSDRWIKSDLEDPELAG